MRLRDRPRPSRLALRTRRIRPPPRRYFELTKAGPSAVRYGCARLRRCLSASEVTSTLLERMFYAHERHNDEQRAAVEHLGGPLLVVAGAGSGKTWTLACRVARLVDRGVPPERILLLT